jgi:ring-1,2-phenylacetyl-CoA epoxidase subunit PaaC
MESPQPSAPLFDYLLHLADNAAILCQRLGAWCGHGPVLEQDIALTNIALDQVGLARMLYQYAGQVEGKGRGEDDLAYLRDSWDFKNCLLVEMPNGDWGQTILRQFIYDAWALPLYDVLSKSTDENLSAIAIRTAKEVRYHYRFSSEWVIRLGDGTNESRQRMVDALQFLWPFVNELTQPAPYEQALMASGVIPDLSGVVASFKESLRVVFEEATLPVPDFDTWSQTGGKTGVHTEHLGYILAEMQHLQRTYPQAAW